MNSVLVEPRILGVVAWEAEMTEPLNQGSKKSYRRPEITILGMAIHIVKSLSKDGEGIDSITASTGRYGIVIADPPAYDLDE